MERLVSEGLGQHARPLQEEADLVLVRHSDPAVQLNALVADEMERLTEVGLRHAHGCRRVGAVLIESGEGVEDHRLGQLQLAEHPCRAVLQRLEAADWNAELLSLLQVLDGASKRLFGTAEHLGGHPCAARIQNPEERPSALAFFSEQAFRTDFDAIQPDERRIVGVDHVGARHVHARGTRIDQEERDPIALALRTRHARAHDQDVCHVSIQHEALLTREPEAAGGSLGLATDAEPAVMRSLLMRQSDELFTGRNAGEMQSVLLLGTTDVQGRDSEKCSREEGRCDEVAPTLLQHDSELSVSEASAAVPFGHQDAGPPQLRHLAPEVLGVARFAALVAQLSKRLHRRLPLYQLAGDLPELDLLFR